MKKILLLLLAVFIVHSAFTAEFIDGRIKLVLNAKTGRFSLYYMTDIAQEIFEPLFAAEDPRTSFLSVIVNNKTYKMGETSVFKTSIGGTPASPSLIFESSVIVVTQNFTFSKTGSSSITNGVIITITITNKGEQTVNAGLRFLIDTDLGEKSLPHFSTNSRDINSETVIDNVSTDQYWVSKNNKLVLVGSIDSPNRPDTIHFANWKRLNDAPWKITPMQGRNFNLLPYSIDDSAICYYYESAPIPKGGARTATISLSSILPAEFDTVIAAHSNGDQAAKVNVPENFSAENQKPDVDIDASAIRNDLYTLRDLVFRLDESINSGLYISDEELAAISLLISRIKLKYSIP
ncbi:MAG: hypothetical protein FWG07_09305 [Treponema sp.]|nr:hypothetical protein [Treponema sp.]